MLPATMRVKPEPRSSASASPAVSSSSPAPAVGPLGMWPLFYKVESAAKLGRVVFNFYEVVFLVDSGQFMRCHSDGSMQRIPEDFHDIIVAKTYIRGHYTDPDSPAGRVARGLDTSDDMEVDEDGRVFIKASVALTR